MTGTDLAKVEQLPDTSGMKHRVVLQRAHDCWFGAYVGQMIRISGARIDYVGTRERAAESELEAALSPDTAAALFVASHHVPSEGTIPLAAFIRICRRAGVPVIIDAAGTVDLDIYLKAGASLVLASAHKNFGGLTAGIVAASILGLVEDFAAEIGGGTTFLLKTATWLGAALLVSLVFATIYRFAPNRRRARWQWLTAGSVGATLVWLLATFAMSLYVSRVGGYNETYGSLGAVVVFLLWLFVSSLVILVGAQLNAEAELQPTADTTVGAPAPAGRRGATVADEVSED